MCNPKVVYQVIEKLSNRYVKKANNSTKYTQVALKERYCYLNFTFIRKITRYYEGSYSRSYSYRVGATTTIAAVTTRPTTIGRGSQGLQLSKLTNTNKAKYR